VYVIIVVLLVLEWSLELVYNSCDIVFMKLHTLVLLLGYLRLGCKARDREQIYEASDWFKEALQINQVFIQSYNMFAIFPSSLLECADVFMLTYTLLNRDGIQDERNSPS